MRTEVPTEDEEQICLFEWAERQKGRWPELGLLFHVPNGGKRTVVEAARFKQMGVRPGVPDVFLPVARGGKHGLFIEMKRRKGGALSPFQKDMLERLREQAYEAVVCRGWEEAAETIKRYLRGE